ncbi:MAG: MYXO-CTERM sorting domain-containing protein [Polyangiales bacterium]
MVALRSAVAACLLLGACAEPVAESTTEQELSAAVRRERATLIRDAAAEMGMFNAALLGGIAISETGLAHCFSEVSFGCPGPDSPSCGGPIIAGGADGPCSDMQGGLGMFQFDSGTYAQTVSTYGPTILTVEGNTAQAVNFVETRLDQDIASVSSWGTAMSYMNNVPLVAGDPTTEEWAAFLACRYNGCCSTSTTCTTRAKGYRDNAIAIYNEYGGAFWRTADRCSALPEDGVIDQRSACYLAAGDPRYWREDATGYGDTDEWTNSTASAAAKNYAQWLFAGALPGRYRIEVYISGGGATKAAYRVAHAGTTEIVTIDQTQVDGWTLLGEYDLAGTGDEHVELGDNTGTAMQKLVFDAVRITSLDGEPPSPESDDGGCSTAGSKTGAGVAFALLAVLRRRRRAV